MHGAMTPRNNTLQQHTATLHEDDHTWRLTQRDARHSNTPQQLLQSWLWTPTDYLFLSSNLSTFYLPIDHPISPSLTSTTQTPIVCLHFYCSSLCIISHPLFHMVDIPNAPFHFTIVVLIDPRSCTDTLSCRPSFVDKLRDSPFERHSDFSMEKGMLLL